MDFLFDSILYVAVPTLLLVIQRQSQRINQLSKKASVFQSQVKAKPVEDKLDDLFKGYEELCSCLPVDEQFYEELVTAQPTNDEAVQVQVEVESDDYWATVEVEVEAPSVTGSKEMNNVVRFLPVQKQPLLLAPAAPSLPTESAGCAVLDYSQMTMAELREMCKGERKFKGYSKYVKRGKKQLIKFMMGC